MNNNPKINRNFWDWKPYFYDAILRQGQRLEKDGQIYNTYFSQNGRTARARTRDGYTVEVNDAPTTYSECSAYAPWKNDLNVRGFLRSFRRDSRYNCTCEVFRSGMLCTHLAALMFRWEKVRGPFIFTETEEERIKREKKDDQERRDRERQRRLSTRVDVVEFLKDHGKTGPSDAYFLPGRVFSNCYTNGYSADTADEMIKSSVSANTRISVAYDPDGMQYLNAETLFDSAKVTMNIAKDGVAKAYCTCYRTTFTGSYSQPGSRPAFAFCEHALVSSLQICDRIAAEDPGDETDRNAARLLSLIAEHASWRSEPGADSRDQVVRLLPRITIDKNTRMPQLSFTIGKKDGKQYVVRSFEKLAEAFSSRQSFEVSKNSSIDFSQDTFTPDSSKWYGFVESRVSEIDRINQRINRYYYNAQHISAGNGVPLEGSELDMVYDMTCGGSILYQPGGRDTETSISVGEAAARANVKLNAIYEEDGSFSGVDIKGSMPRMLRGSQYQYILDDKQLGRVPAEDIAALRAFRDIANDDGSFSARVGRKKLPELYYRVLPALQASSRIEVDDSGAEIPEGAMPVEPRFGFYLDIPDDRIICGSFAMYGDESIPLPAHRDEGLALRDFDQEKRVLESVMKYFPQYNDENRTFYTDYSDDALVRVLTEAVPELSGYGEVNGSSAFKQVKVYSAPQAKVSLQIDGGLLDLQVQTSDLDQDELLSLLSSYRLKKKWHRLRSGDYVDLRNAEQLDELEDLAADLNISMEDLLKGDLHIPLYRALYLDRLLEEHDQIAASRDRNFKSLVRSFSTVRDSDFEVPESLADVMRPYQVFGFRWLSTVAQSGFGGILADEMGLGKTLQILALLLSLKQGGEEKPALVVCPASLVYNWKEEVQRFTPELSTRLVEGGAGQRRLVFADMKSGDHADIYVTSYDLLKRDVANYQDVDFSTVILDEAQYIKNSGTASAKSVKTLKADHRFALTGTPIENRLSELWSIFDFLMPGFLYTAAEFSSRFEVPIMKRGDLAATQKLSRMIAPFILRRRKVDVLKDLPDKLEEVQSQEMEEDQRKLYDAQVVRTKQLLEDGSGEEDKMRILAEITRLRQLCCDPSLLFDDYTGSSAKRSACLELVQRAIDGGHRLLIFSQFTSMLDLLAQDLRANEIPFYTITGATPKQDRIRLVNEFNSGDVPVFLISLKAGGTGLNLTGADVVVHYDPWWNLAVQNQATDRAHRIGQTKIVNVVKLIAANSIEERIVKLQDTKQDLADAVLGSQSGSLMSLSREELLELLE